MVGTAINGKLCQKVTVFIENYTLQVQCGLEGYIHDKIYFLGAFLSAEPAEIKGCVNIWCLCHKRLPLALSFPAIAF